MEDIFWTWALWLSAFTSPILFFFISWATRQGFPALSVPINSAQTQTRFPGAYGPLQGPHVWALGCTAVWLSTWYLQELLNDEETYHSTPIWQSLTSDPKEIWNMSATALLPVTGSSLNESVKRLEGFQESILPSLKPPAKHLLASHHQG